MQNLREFLEICLTNKQSDSQLTIIGATATDNIIGNSKYLLFRKQKTVGIFELPYSIHSSCSFILKMTAFIHIARFHCVIILLSGFYHVVNSYSDYSIWSLITAVTPSTRPTRWKTMHTLTSNNQLLRETN